jgi:hypothetical protein
MIKSKGGFYGVMAVLVSLLIFSSTVAALYYGRYQNAASQNQVYSSELETALASYRTLQGSYNASLADYNATLALLASAVGSLNTSTPAYGNASAALGTLWASYQRLADLEGGKAAVYEMKVLVDYGNGSSTWYNDSTAQPGWNAYVATLALLKGEVDATWYPQYGEHLVIGLNQVMSNSSDAWFLWQQEETGWVVASSGADGIAVQNGTVIAWTLCGYDASFNPTCTP